MKKVYIITYDHDGPTEDLADLFAELKSFAAWWHYIDGTWLVVVEDLDAGGIYRRLKPVLPPGVNILVIEAGADRQGWLPRKAWAWIKRNIPKTPADAPEQ